MRPYIGDGYDREIYIEGKEGLYPSCKFNGRMMAHHQTAAVLRDTVANPENADTIYATAIAERLTGWAYKDGDIWKPFDNHDGAKLPINAANVGGLSFGLFTRLRDVVLGLEPADIDPATGQAVSTPGADAKN